VAAVAAATDALTAIHPGWRRPGFLFRSFDELS
jgi:hypothetical protein